MNTPSTTKKRQARGVVRKEGATFIAAWIPDDIVAALDAAVEEQDTDRSKLIRKAVRQLLARPA